ncbi:UNVERIFIED_CONTAM: hypothetical protein FKN15_069165 [Acipenser sinensis]
MLWGYEDPILKQLRLPDPHTGVFYPYNGTADGYYNIFTGRGNIEKLGIIDRWQGMPVYISLPHFLYGSEALQEAIDGMEPNEEEHSTFLDVEPVTGISLNVAKRLQVNIAVQPSNQIEVLSNIKEPILFPLVWLNETATVDDATAEELKGALISTMDLLETIQMTLIGCGCVIFLACIISLCVLKKKKKTSKKTTLISLFFFFYCGGTPV